VNDVFFAIHAAIISILTLTQIYCWGYARSRRQVPSGATWGIVVGSSLAIGILCCIAVISNGNVIEWIDVCYGLSYVKLLCTFVKYVPQVFFSFPHILIGGKAVLNYRRQSTIGWSIHNILLVWGFLPFSLTLQDFSGGLLSLAQLFLDAFLSNDFSGIVGNLAKLGLSLLAMSFDVLFIFQHYVLYPQQDKSDASESQPILQSGAE